MGPVDEQLAPAALAECDPYVAIELGHRGGPARPGGAEVAEGRYVGGPGGQAGFFRAAGSRYRLAIVAVAATNADGSTSRIVPAVSGPATQRRATSTW